MKSRIRHSTTITYKFPIEAEILHENLRTSESTKVISLASLKFLSQGFLIEQTNHQIFRNTYIQIRREAPIYKDIFIQQKIGQLKIENLSN